MRFKINESTLKIIAMVSMFIDHAAVAFPAVVPEGSAAYFVMRVIGRIAAPVFFWLLVQGYHHSSDLRKYLLRLLILSLIHI